MLSSSSSALNISQTDLPIALQHLQVTDRFKKEFNSVVNHHFNALKGMTVKMLSKVKSTRPTREEVLLCTSFTLLFSSLDTNIRLTNDKSNLHDKSWCPGIS